MAGMIAGCITVTGLASKLISGVIAISSAIPNPTLSLLLALFLTMLCCIVLGMGVPTTANYCIMASTCAPILITLGIPKVAAHFFVFYFGIVADITPAPAAHQGRLRAEDRGYAGTGVMLVAISVMVPNVERPDYLPLFLLQAAFVLVSAVVYGLLVKEPALVRKMHQKSLEMGIREDEVEKDDSPEPVARSAWPIAP